MVSTVSPPRIGLWDHFQIAFSWFAHGGDPITTYDTWDDPPSTLAGEGSHTVDGFLEIRRENHLICG